MNWLRHRNGGGRIFGNDADVIDSYIDRASAIGDRVEVYESRVYSSVLSDDVIVGGAIIENSHLSGSARIINSQIQDVDLHNAKVFGRAYLVGPWSLSGFVRLHGIWHRAPKFTEISDGDVHVMLSECHLADYWHVGCWCRPWETWRTRGHAYGKAAGWSKGLVDEALAILSGWRSASGNRKPEHAPTE